MTKALSSGNNLRFAAVALLIVAVVAAVFAFMAGRTIEAQQEAAAADSTANLIGEPLGALIGGLAATGAPIPTETRFRIDQAVRPLLTGDVRTFRVWTDDGRLLYSADRAPAGQAPASHGDDAVSWTRGRAGDGTPVFITYVASGDLIAEIAQDSAPIDAAITGAKTTLYKAISLGALAGFVMLFATYWYGMRRFSADHRRLLYLYTTGQQIRSSLDLHEVMAHLSRDATELARGDDGLIALFDPDNGDMVLRATYDHATGSIAHHQKPVEEWFLRRSAATSATVIATQPGATVRALFAREQEWDGEVAVLCIPMSLRGRVVGVLAVARRASGRQTPFAQSEVALVSELADQAVMAVEQARLFAKVRSYASELESSYDTTLKVLMAALDTKDDVTEGHCERVAKLTVHLARAMDVPEHDLVDIERGALLHDVGKIGVPDAVLKKPHELNRGEWEAMQKHPLLAGLMVSKVDFLQGALPILLYHHERYDGSGYPFGLTEDKIPLEARIFAVVDSYDAMTSDRPYRQAMSHDAAMAEITENSGTQFDPGVVREFERLMAARPDLHQHGRPLLPTGHDHHDAPLPAA